MNVTHTVEAIDAYLAANDIEAAIFVGHSFGAHVAMTYAIARPKRCSHLILLNPVGLFPIAGCFSYWHALVMKTLVFATGSVYDKIMIDRHIVVRGLHARFRHPLVEAVRMLLVPLILIHSDGDFNPIEHARTFAQLFRGNALRIIPGSHSARAERARAISDAVDDLKAGRGCYMIPGILPRGPMGRIWTVADPFEAEVRQVEFIKLIEDFVARSSDRCDDEQRRLERHPHSEARRPHTTRRETRPPLPEE